MRERPAPPDFMPADAIDGPGGRASVSSATPKARPLAKLSPPRLHEAVARERLFALLDAHGDRSVSWISGPPGAGKTTLLASYLGKRRRKSLWYRIDPGDSDASSLFSFLAQAALQLSRKVVNPLPALTPEYLLDVPGFTRRFFRELFHAVPDLEALVFDGCESAPGDALPTLIAIAATELPTGSRILCTSREAPPAGLSHLRANRGVGSLEWSDLRLTPDEARAIARGGRDARDPVDALLSQCDGWVAGFVLMLESRRKGGGSSERATGGVRDLLFSYFVSEMFSRADIPARNVLMRTATVSGFTLGEAEAICPDCGARDVVSGLFRQQYFIDRSEGDEPVYRYHALFRDFLLQQAERLMSHDERAAHLGHCAAILEAGNRSEEAAGLYAQAGDWPEAARVLAALAPRFLVQGRNASLDRAISALPARVISASPWLQYWLGMARLVFDPPGAIRLMEAAYAGFKESGNHAACVLACAGILEAYYVVWSDVAPTDPWARALAFHMDQPGALDDDDVEARAVLSISALFHRPDVHVDLFNRLFDRGLEIVRGPGNRMHRVMIAGVLGILLMSRGQIRTMGQLMPGVEAALAESDIPPLWRVFWQLSKAWYHHQLGRFEAAYKENDRAVALTVDYGIRVIDVMVIAQNAEAAFAAGDLDRAEACIDKMRVELRPGRLLDAANIDFQSGILAMARGDAREALRRARAAIEVTTACGSTLLTHYSCIPLAYAQLALGDHAAALETAGSILRFARRSPMHAFEYPARMMLAAGLLATGETVAARAELQSALAFARERGMLVIIPWAPIPFMQRLFGFALSEGVEVAYVRDVIARLGMPAPAGAPEAWPWPVRVHTMGRFEVQVDGAALVFGRKLPRRPLTLLKFLIARGGRARVDSAIDALWGDEEGDAAAGALEVALHRLRRLLGRPQSVDLQDGVLGLDRSIVWVDALAMDADGREPGSAQAQSFLQAYRGHFLPGEEVEPWSMAMRERLRTRFGRIAAQVGQTLLEQGRFDSAREHFERAIDADELAEPLYQGLMRACLALGQRDGGLSAYRRLRRVLQGESGLAPSEESEALLAALRDAPR